MEKNSKNLIFLSYVGWIASLIIHICSIMNYVFFPRVIPMLLFILFIFLYLQNSKWIREMNRQPGDIPFWRVLFNHIPVWLKWAVGVFAIYAIVNFSMFYVKNDVPGYLNFDVSAAKLRIVSGFLMALFFALTALIKAIATEQQDQM